MACSSVSCDSVSRDADPSLKHRQQAFNLQLYLYSVSRDADPSLKRDGAFDTSAARRNSVSRDADPSLKLRYSELVIRHGCLFGQ